jgi:serine/threonine protein phosphatase 1
VPNPRGALDRKDGALSFRSLASRLLKGGDTPGRSAAPRTWTAPAGTRVYAVGDIHGRLDLLEKLFRLIDADDAGREAARTILIFLGDYVDRGSDSRGVIEFLLQCEASDLECIFLGGNHDEVFARAAAGEERAASTLHRMGGRETALSYGITAEEYDRGSFGNLAELLRERVPATHVAFLRKLAEWYQIGDYIFVHAGIRPGTPMRDQQSGDLRWIRREFLDHSACHGAMIVHGHTVTDEPDSRSNRIGIDTGAYQSGKLTAIGLEGGERWILST